MLTEYNSFPYVMKSELILSTKSNFQSDGYNTEITFIKRWSIT